MRLLLLVLASLVSFPVSGNATAVTERAIERRISDDTDHLPIAARGPEQTEALRESERREASRLKAGPPLAPGSGIRFEATSSMRAFRTAALHGDIFIPGQHLIRFFPTAPPAIR